MAHARLAVPGGGHPQGDGETVHGEKEGPVPGMFRKLVASGIAAKVLQEARKPQNQEKAKQMFAQWQQKRGGSGKGRGPVR